MDIQRKKDSLIERAASAYSQDRLDEPAYEAFVIRVQAAAGDTELQEAEASLGSLLPAVLEDSPLEDIREFSLNMGNLKKRGDWVDAKSYRLEGRMSNFDLDFRDYQDARDFSMILNIDLSMSNLKLIIPPEWRVEDRISSSSGSNFIDRGRDIPRGGCQLVVRGTLSMSNVIVRRKGPKRGFLAWLFGR